MKWEKGITIAPIEVIITPELVNLYAEVSGDHNRLHLDEEFARTTRFGTRIGHGMLTMAAVAEMLTKTFGQSWAKNAQLEVSFVAPVLMGVTMRTYGLVVDVNHTRDGVQVMLEVGAMVNGDQRVLTGTATIFLSP